MANNKTGFIYYSTDTNRYQDIKIKRLKKDFGCSGISVYDYLLCEIYRVKGCFLVWDSSTAFDVADYFGLKESLVYEIVNYCANVGLFDKAVLSRESVLTSHSIQKRFIDWSRKAKRTLLEIPEKYLILTEESKIIQEECIESSLILPQSKVKESKVISMGDKSPPSSTSFKIWDDKKFIEDIRVHGEDYPKDLLNTFFKYWSEKGASGKMKFQMEKTWETAKRLSNWQRNEEKWAK